MKIFLQLILTIILAFVLGQFLPFWSMAVGAFFVALLIGRGLWPSFYTGFISIGLLWAVSGWFFSDANNHIMLERVAGIFKLAPVLILLVMSLIGGLLGGLAAATGSQLHRIVAGRKRRRENPYWIKQ